DVLVRVVGLEMEQLGDRQVGDLVVDRGAEEDDPLVEEARVDVEGALAVHGLLDHHRNHRAYRCSLTRCSSSSLRLHASQQAAAGAHSYRCLLSTSTALDFYGGAS